MALATQGRAAAERRGLERGRVGMLGRLTPRETDVLAAMAEGKTNAAIAATLFLSRRAIEKHINAIFSKLSLTGDEERHARVHAVLIYLTQADVEASVEASGEPATALLDLDRPAVWRHPDRVHRHQYTRAGRRRTVAVGQCGAVPMLSAVGP